MISPQIIHNEPYSNSISSYNINSESSKYKSDSDSFRQQQQQQQPGDGGSRNGNSAGNSGESSSSNSQKKPKKEIDSTKPYKCTQCEYSFNRRDHLTRHALVHSKLKPYNCSYCSKVSKYKMNIGAR